MSSGVGLNKSLHDHVSMPLFYLYIQVKKYIVTSAKHVEV